MKTVHGRNKQIDGLRGIIVVMISFFHVFCRYQQIYEDVSIPFVEYWGDFGVIVFLIISAYFLTKATGKVESHPRTKIKKFFKYISRKIIRLWPSYFVAITVIMFFSFIIPAPSRECSWLEYFCNIPFINGFIGVGYVDGAHWYLTYLIAISVIVGLFCCHDVEDNPFIYLAWLIACALLYEFFGVGLSRLLGGGYSGIACCGIAMSFLQEDKGKKLWCFLMIMGVVYTVIIQGVTSEIMLIIGCAVFSLTVMRKLQFLELNIFQFLGQISYPLYLIHQNISYGIIYKLSETLGGYRYLYSLLAYGFVFILACILYFTVEKPVTLIKLKKRMR